MSDFPSPSELQARASACQMVAIDQDCREEFGCALILQGYSPERAAEMARTLPESDGALQMLGRQRFKVPADVAELVVAARIYLFEDEGEEARRQLDKASEAFAARVPWDDEPVTEDEVL